MDILKLLKGLSHRLPLFRPVIANLSFNVDNNIETACTNGVEVLYSEAFFKTLNEEERLFVLAHELSHMALNHLNRRKDKDAYLWNIATDAVINAFLVRDGFIPPEGLIFIDGALEYSAEELYNKLKNQELPIPDDLDEAIEIAIGSHSSWDSSDGENSKDLTPKIDEAGNITIKPEGDIFNENKELRDKLSKELKEKIKADFSGFFEGLGIGESPVRTVSRIGKESNLIEWRNILKEGARLDLDYSFKDAQIEDGVLVSNLIEIPTCMTEILVDTSGSIDEPLLRAFLRECKTVLQVSRLRIAFFDQEVYDFMEIRTPMDIDKLKIKGGGGTNFTKASKAFSSDCDNKIIFTDGMGYCSNPPKDIVWVLFSDYDMLPKNLKKIRVDEKSLRRSLRA